MTEEDGAGEFDLLVEKIGKVGEMVSTVKEDTETAIKKALKEQSESFDTRFAEMEAKIEAVEKKEGDKKKKDMDYKEGDEDYEEGDGKKKKGKNDDGVTKLLEDMADEIKKLKEVPHYKGTADGQNIMKMQGEGVPKSERVDLVRMAITGRVDA